VQPDHVEAKLGAEAAKVVVAKVPTEAAKEAKAEEANPTVKLFGKIATIKSRMRMVIPP
jgi:hypothetical protein